MQNDTFLLYGATGYTAQIIISLAKEYGLKPILAGRNEEAISAVAKQYNLPYRIANLDNKDQLDRALKDVTLILNAAGPFKRTAKPIIEACIKNKVNYIDITGEIPVFEEAKSYDDAAKVSGIILLPGAGFDVVPTDCMALFLKNSLPDATSLRLAFTSLGGGLSHGTATTMAENLGEGGMVRQKGKLVKKPLGHKGMWVNFGAKRLFVMSIPWGDISTAYTTTGIQNIETYTGIKP
ncbi:MAG TPA: saccharopine dehydrogenase NADP-binding domain-containing protein, partial [Chitinophagaceae bacterium]|nr:saccharopine dehydrogenase NADP-binding domain-containing protein [Chitinophagaceae bacterium]